MKKLLLLILGLISSINLFSQDSIVNYLDRKYKKVSKDKATYIQTIVKKDSLWLGNVYFGNGKIKLQGQFKDKKLKTRIGSFKSYNIKGNLKSILNYNDKGKKEGLYLYFNNEGEQITKGYFIDNEKEGLWKFYYSKESLKAKIIYKNGKIIRYFLLNEDGTEKKEKLIFEQKAKYKGGIKRLHKEISAKLTPKLKGLGGNFFVDFYVDVDGKVKNVSITPSFSKNFREKEEFIIKFFNDLPKWEPAIQLNSPVKVKYTIPIKLN